MITLFYVIVYDEFNISTKKWERKRDLYNSLDSAILMRTYLSGEKKYCVKRIEELIMRTYCTGFVEFV